MPRSSRAPSMMLASLAHRQNLRRDWQELASFRRRLDRRRRGSPRVNPSRASTSPTTTVDAVVDPARPYALGFHSSVWGKPLKERQARHVHRWPRSWRRSRCRLKPVPGKRGPRSAGSQSVAPVGRRRGGDRPHLCALPGRSQARSAVTCNCVARNA
jgi:hypothetical protein